MLRSVFSIAAAGCCSCLARPLRLSVFDLANFSPVRPASRLAAQHHTTACTPDAGPADPRPYLLLPHGVAERPPGTAGLTSPALCRGSLAAPTRSCRNGPPDTDVQHPGRPVPPAAPGSRPVRRQAASPFLRRRATPENQAPRLPPTPQDRTTPASPGRAAARPDTQPPAPHTRRAERHRKGGGAGLLLTAWGSGGGGCQTGEQRGSGGGGSPVGHRARRVECGEEV